MNFGGVMHYFENVMYKGTLYRISSSAVTKIRGLRILRVRQYLKKLGASPGDYMIWNAKQNTYQRYSSLDVALFSRFAIASNNQHETLEIEEFVSTNWHLCYWLANWRGMKPKDRAEYERLSRTMANTLGAVRDEHKVLMKFWSLKSADLHDSTGKLNPGAARAMQSASATHGESRVDTMSWITLHVDADKVALLRERQRCISVVRRAKKDIENIRERALSSFVEGSTEDIRRVSTLLRSLEDNPWKIKANKAADLLRVAVDLIQHGSTPEAMQRLAWAILKLRELELYVDLSDLHLVFARTCHRSSRDTFPLAEVQFVQEQAHELMNRLLKRKMKADPLSKTEFGERLLNGLNRFVAEVERGCLSHSLTDAREQFTRILISV